jgi:nucleotide-binding universal stress UspA family protein
VTTRPEPARGTGFIVVGVDGSRGATHAVDWAARQAARTGSRLELTVVWEWPTTLGLSYMSVPNNYDPSDDAEAILGDAVKRALDIAPGIDVRPVALEGHPAPVLVERSRGAELLVVGNRGHGGFTGMLIGSVSQHCVTQAHCPVVVVREP